MRSVVLQFLDSAMKPSKVSTLFSYARFGRVAIDTKRKELYIVAQLAKEGFSKVSTPKLPFGIIVKKTTLTGDALADGEVIVKAGETGILHSSLSCFYDFARDRLVIKK